MPFCLRASFSGRCFSTAEMVSYNLDLNPFRLGTHFVFQCVFICNEFFDCFVVRLLLYITLLTILPIHFKRGKLIAQLLYFCGKLLVYHFQFLFAVLRKYFFFSSHVRSTSERSTSRIIQIIQYFINNVEEYIA